MPYKTFEKEKKIDILNMIASDMRKDAEAFDGQPFNGRTVAKYLAYQGAAISALADMIRSILEGDN